jgi:hypothetical protein
MSNEKVKIPEGLFAGKAEKRDGATTAPDAPRRPTRCRVKLPDKMSLPIIGGGSSAFDAEFDWDRMVAIGTVEGRTIMVGCQLAAIAFYKDAEPDSRGRK